MMASDGPSRLPPSLRLGLAAQPRSHQNATTPGSCWAPHFMTRERLMFSNPTLSETRLSPAAMMSDDILSAPTQPFSSRCRF